MPPLVGRLDCFHPFQIPPATVGEPFYYCENDSAPSHALVRQSLTHEMELTSFGGWDSLTSSSTHFAADDMARHTTASHSGKKMKHSKKLSGPTEHRRAKRRRSKHNVPTGLVRSKALKCHLSTLGTSIKPLQRDAPNSISADDNALRTDAFGKPVLTNPATSAFNDISNNTSKNYEPRIPYSHPHLEEIDFANEFDVDSWIDLAEVTAKLTTTYQGGRKTLPDTTLLRKRLASTTLRGPVSVDDTMKMYSGVCRRMNGCLH
uniref:Uncharacterized protein n=1 Tax=Craspedostauros australis TaxID=1486917 RepID=A0A7R9WTS6_9STRA